MDFEFAGGENSIGYHIIAEFYASVSYIYKERNKKKCVKGSSYVFKLLSICDFIGKYTFN